MSDNLSKLFGIDPMKNNLPTVVDEAKTVDDDAIEAKQNLKDLIATGTKALESAYDLAIQSESPRAFEVLKDLIVSLADLNMRVLDVHSKKADINKKNQTRTEPSAAPQQITGDGAVVNNTTNIVFEGTTAQLAEYIKSLNQPKPINDGDIIENEPKQD